jgi:hypothetical protein
MSKQKLWLWKNGPHEFWAFDNPYPCDPNGDPITLGEPVGYAFVMQSVNGRPDVPEDEVVQQMKRARK